MANKTAWNEPALNKVEELVSQSNIRSLRAVHKLYREHGPTVAFENTNHLCHYACQGNQSIEETVHADRNGDVEQAKMHWASALVLMEILDIETENILNDKMVVSATENQKSGKTG